MKTLKEIANIDTRLGSSYLYANLEAFFAQCGIVKIMANLEEEYFEEFSEELFQRLTDYHNFLKE